MVSEWPEFSFLIIDSLAEEESDKQKCSKLVENHPINQFGMRNLLEMASEWLEFSFLINGSPEEKEPENRKCSKIGRKSSYKPILTWWIDWKWFQKDPISLSWSLAPLMKKSPKIENVPNWSKIIISTNFDMKNWLEMVSELSEFSFMIIGPLKKKSPKIENVPNWSKIII